MFDEDFNARAAKIKLFLMDVDGVMTDGKLHYVPGPDGVMVESKGFNSQDGFGLRLLSQLGISTGLISGMNSPATVERARITDMTFVYQGCLDKIEAWNSILKETGLKAEQVAFIGDDLLDVPLIHRAGLGIAPMNARSEVKAEAHFVTAASGGEGAVREVVDLLLRSQGLWEQVLDKYFRTVAIVT